jgi:FG-GAP-like repeat/FG-GAP repeat
MLRDHSWKRGAAFVAVGLACSVWLCGQVQAQSLIWEASPPYPYTSSASGTTFTVKDTLGDVNGDGVADILISDSMAPLGSIPNAGYVAVLSGVNGSTLYSAYGTGMNDGFQAVGAVGDVTGDGIADFITNRASTGLQLRSGATGAVVPGFSFPAVFDVAGIGDINGDGFGDFVVGGALTPGPVPSAGGVTVFLGPTGTTTAYQAYGLNQLDNFGWSVAPLGDVNGDSVPDFVVGAPGVPWKFVNVPGWAYVISGTNGAILQQFTGPGTVQPYFGKSVSGIGDIDLDGFPDVLVAAPNIPALYVYSGGSGALLTTIQVPWQSPNSFASHVRGLGDVDGDGVPDVAVRGQLGLNPNPPYAAPVTVYSGATFTPLYQVDHLLAEPPYYVYGWTFDGAGDVDGDGFFDIAITAQTFQIGATAKIVMASLRPAGVTAFGSGCPSDTGLIPRIAIHPAVTTGATVQFNLSGAAVGRCSALALGLSNTTYGGLTLPWFPFPVTGPSCGVLVSVDQFSGPILTQPASGGMGRATYILNVPNVPGLTGLPFYAQWAIENSPGWMPTVSVTRGLHVTIQ